MGPCWRLSLIIAVDRVFIIVTLLLDLNRRRLSLIIAVDRKIIIKHVIRIVIW